VVARSNLDIATQDFAAALGAHDLENPPVTDRNGLGFGDSNYMINGRPTLMLSRVTDLCDQVGADDHHVDHGTTRVKSSFKGDRTRLMIRLGRHLDVET